MHNHRLEVPVHLHVTGEVGELALLHDGLHGLGGGSPVGLVLAHGQLGKGGADGNHDGPLERVLGVGLCVKERVIGSRENVCRSVFVLKIGALLGVPC